ISATTSSRSCERSSEAPDASADLVARDEAASTSNRGESHVSSEAEQEDGAEEGHEGAVAVEPGGRRRGGNGERGGLERDGRFGRRRGNDDGGGGRAPEFIAQHVEHVVA